MLIQENFASHAAKLLDPELRTRMRSPRGVGGECVGRLSALTFHRPPPIPCPCAAVDKRLHMVTEIRDSIEIVHTNEYPKFLEHFFEPVCQLLREGQPQFRDGPAQKVRNTLLEVVHRLPNNDSFRPYVERMLQLCMGLLDSDNEENAVLCLRIIFDLHKNFRPTLEREVPPFLDFVKRVYASLPETAKRLFVENAAPITSQAPGAGGFSGTSPQHVLAATQQDVAHKAKVVQQIQAAVQTATRRQQQTEAAVNQAQQAFAQAQQALAAEQSRATSTAQVLQAAQAHTQAAAAARGPR